ncbi:hypothetical protein BpHYR1_022632 [Brachionus plicatilis]|uniref:Uncharacterized protein n=1 Tax=Brachionus plicatilis TaxID=10195 RepID=A0A3M7Q5I8_BRAPC|nr:hypothetical protein BpHYR1_022632 [Brachionus plicatilis]
MIDSKKSPSCKEAFFYLREIKIEALQDSILMVPSRLVRLISIFKAFTSVKEILVSNNYTLNVQDTHTDFELALIHAISITFENNNLLLTLSGFLVL